MHRIKNLTSLIKGWTTQLFIFSRIVVSITIKFHVVELVTPNSNQIDMEGAEFCLMETASAECPEGHHVNILWGLLGRMRRGGCIKDNYDLDCYDDVAVHLRDICRGQRRCSVGVNTLTPLARSCPRNREVYLQTHYECVKGMCNYPCKRF